MKEERKIYFHEMLEPDHKVSITYDRSGGMRIIREKTGRNGLFKYEEVYIPRDAMMTVALNLLNEKKA